MSEVVEEIQAEEIVVTEEEVVTPKVEDEPKVHIDVDTLKKEFIEMVRREEKDKLYKSMEKTKEELKAEKDAKAVLEAKIKEYEEKNLTADEKTALKIEELAKANADLKDALDRVSSTAAQQIYEVQLEAAKEKVLAKYGDDIIVEMISGSTIEEINESAERAHETYKRITERATELVNQTRRETTTTNVLAPKVNDVHTAFSPDLDKIKDPQEWEKVRANLLEKALRG